MLLLALSLTAPAPACDSVPLEVRTTIPQHEAVGVPVDARLVVGFIGTGTADEFQVALLRDGATVETEAWSWCYEHEGPVELHCWWSLDPVEELSSDSLYLLRVESTELWQGEGEQRRDVSFTTGDSRTEPLDGAPTLEILDLWEEEAETSCDYPLAQRYSMQVTAVDGLPDLSAMSLYHLEELDEHGASLGVVHSIYVTNAGGSEASIDMKQYQDASVPRSGCFRLVQEDPAGNRSAPAVACWTPPDTGSEEPPDTGSDSGAAPEDSGDGGEEGAPPDSGNGGAHAAPAETDPGCGCGGGSVAGLSLVLLALPGLRRGSRSRRRPQPPHSTATSSSD